MSFLKPSQRRKHERVTVFIPVRIFKNGKEAGKGEVEDLSMGGVYIRTTVPVKLGDKVEVEFQFAAMKSVLGTVVEIGEIDNKAPVRVMTSGSVRWDRNGTGFGIEFSSMPAEVQRVVKKMVKYMAQIQKSFAAMG